MEKLLIQGGERLSGTIRVSGAKNAVLPIMAASLLFDTTIELKNIPHLRDVTTMLSLLSCLGGDFVLKDGDVLEVNAANLTSCTAPYELVKTMRASILALGPLLARFGHAEISMPGGCAIGSRPVDVHVKAMEALGAQIELVDGFIKATVQGRLQGAEIDLGKITVTGTENILMAAVLAEGTTVIHSAACEPEVSDLARFLNLAGAKISGIGTSRLEIIGVRRLHAVSYSVMPDRIEAGTYLVAAAMTRGEVCLTHSRYGSMTAILDKLREAGADVRCDESQIHLSMHGNRPRAVDVTTAPYPDFPTDMQAQFLAMNAIASGSSTVSENVFENRFMHVPELKRMGAKIELEGRLARCEGVESLRGAPVMATDLRASAGLVLAGLVADSVTIVDRVYHVDRGYECIEEKLARLGANIRRVNSLS